MFLKVFIVFETAGAVSFLLDNSEVVSDLSEPLRVLRLRREQDRVLLLLLLPAARAGLEVGGEILAGPELVLAATTGEERHSADWQGALQVVEQGTLRVKELGLRFGAHLVEKFDTTSTTIVFFSQVSQRLLLIQESRWAETALPIVPAVSVGYVEQH